MGQALCTDPADRAATEEAITTLYALVDQSRPAFVWVDSPSAAAQVLPSTPYQLRADGPWPPETRLASLVSTLRQRLDYRLGTPRPAHARPAPAPPDPVAALRSGTTLRSILDAGVRGTLRQVIRESVAGLIRAAAPELSGLVWYGQHEADWVAHYDIHRRITGARLDGADAAQLELWATLARSCGWWWPRDRICVVAERPSTVHTEPVPDSGYGQVRLHAATGPAVAFPDGSAVHAWHGTKVPSWVIDAPTVERIAAERNVEVRRCAIERIGWPTFVEQAGLALVARAGDPGNSGCELRLYDLPYPQWGTATRLLLTVNGSAERDGTRRRYGLRVPAWFDDPIDAAGWTYGLTGPQYAQLQRRT